TVDRRREEPSVRVARIVPIDDAPRAFCREVIVRVATAAADPELVRRVFDVCSAHRGPATMYLEVRDPAGRRATIRGQRGTALDLSSDCVAALAACVGSENVLGYGPRGAFVLAN